MGVVEVKLCPISIEAKMPNGEKIHTGYGVRGKEEMEQTLELVSRIALESGFKADGTEAHKNWFSACFHRVIKKSTLLVED